MIEPDRIETAHGTLVVQPVNHASLVLICGEAVLYVDPVGGARRYGLMPRPTGIVVTHEHRDHLDPDTIADLVAGRQVPLIASVAAREMMPTALRNMTVGLANGESGQIDGIPVTAYPAHNVTEGKTQHPEGRGNGYLLSLDGMPVYVAGDTEPTPDLLALTGIGIMFLPMNQPYTMTPGQVAEVINAVRPRIAYVYHYKGSDPAAVPPLVEGSGTEVRLRDWYADA